MYNNQPSVMKETTPHIVNISISVQVNLSLSNLATLAETISNEHVKYGVGLSE